ncbi:nuclear transport factor 2 family protein [uncultured Chitinophaga sp.]|uniref:nuclear transport factor 2 family protein n=1 Tax=uncultured Chitinophaga sp. TaxID=339340 RepID=UPI0025DF137A|nr:nuclear transport factor 2 family protein [uncultured Chitinophaga sp.]
MKIKLILLFVAALSISNALWAQNGEIENVKTVVNRMFEGMRNGDSAAVRAVLADRIIMQTVVAEDGAETRVATGDVNRFLKAVGTPHTDVWDERIEFGQVLVDGNLASVWTPYQFYLGSKLSHCGVNSFQLVRLPEGWKIVFLIDTRRKDCK